MITIITIMGAGENPALPGDLLGMRSFVADLCQECAAVSQFFAHDDPRLDAGFANIDGQIVLLGHSFGGYESLRAVHNLDLLNRKVEILCLMDPKPKPFAEWINPLYEFPLPTNVATMQCFWGGFGRPFVEQRFSQHLNIAHAAFPSDPNVHSWIREAMLPLAKQPQTPDLR